MARQLDEYLMTEKEVCEMLGLKPRTLQSWRLFGRGPQFVRLSDRIIRYRMSDVEDWIASVQERQKVSKLS